MPPTDSNKFDMVKFIDHKHNYGRVFVAIPNTRLLRSSKRLWLTSRGGCSTSRYTFYVLGDGENKCVDMLWKCKEVRRQLSKSNNQSSNQKEERMHRTVLNMARYNFLVLCLCNFRYSGTVCHVHYQPQLKQCECEEYVTTRSVDRRGTQYIRHLCIWRPAHFLPQP